MVWFKTVLIEGQTLPTQKSPVESGEAALLQTARMGPTSSSCSHLYAVKPSVFSVCTRWNTYQYDIETGAEHAAENEDGDAAPTLLTTRQSRVVRRKARTAATTSDTAIPATQAGHPIRSKI
jgi:hypothetical protein